MNAPATITRAWYDSLHVLRLCRALFELRTLHYELATGSDPLMHEAAHAVGTIERLYVKPDIDSNPMPEFQWKVVGGTTSEIYRILGEFRTRWMEIELIKVGKPKEFLHEPAGCRPETAELIQRLHRETPSVEAAIEHYLERKAGK